MSEVMKVVPISKAPNNDAIDMLERTIERVKSGEIESVALSWVTENNTIGGVISKGDSNILMFAAIEHTARSFYNDYLSAPMGEE